MKKVLNRIEVAEKFLRFEKDRDLTNFKISNVFPWQISRTWLFLEFINFFKGATLQTIDNSFKKKISKVGRILANSIFHNPFLDFRQKQIIVFQTDRKYLVKDTYFDIYTYYLVEKLTKDGQKIVSYETVFENFSNKVSLKFNSKIKHLDFLRLCVTVVQPFVKPKFSASEIHQINLLEENCLSEFHHQISLIPYFSNAIKKFKAEYIVYKVLFSIKKPKEIYVVGSSDKAALIFAAKKVGILVNELQHGLNSEKDVILNYPYTTEDSLAYFPNRFFVWNNINMFFAKLPLSKSNIISIPNYHICNMLKETKHVLKEKQLILIISQPHGSEQILDYVVKNITNLQDYEILYKIHPTESQNISVFEQKLKFYKNVRIVQNEESLYILLKKSAYVVGIYSSALYEASVFDCTIILLNLPEVEFSLNLLDNPKCLLLDTNESIINILTKEL